MNAFLEAIRKITRLSPGSERLLREQLKSSRHGKGEKLLKADSICRKVWFIDKGAARVYYIKDGKEVTDWIGLENEFILAIPSFFLQTPSSRTIELLEDTELTSISYTALESLYSRNHELERMGRLIGNHALMLLSRRVEDLMFKSSVERYQSLLATHPQIVRRIPLGIVASYLGMTQETLSRMRARF